MTAPREEPKAAPTWLGLSAQMFVLVILPFAALALTTTLVSLWLHQNAMRGMIAERDTRAVSTAAKFLESKIESEQQTAAALAMNRRLVAGSDADILSAFVQSNNGAGKNLALVSGTGEILAFSGNAEVRDALTGKTLKPGQVLTDQIHGAYHLWFTSESQMGVLTVNIVPLAPLVQDALGEHPHDMGQAAAFLVDRSGQALISLGQIQWNDRRLSAYTDPKAALHNKSGFGYVNVDGTEHVIAYSPVNEWTLVIEEPWEMVDTPYLRLTQFAPLILLPLLAVTLLAMWFGLSQIIGPLRRLEMRAAALAWGDFAAIEQPVGGVREIRQLQNELVHMARKVQDAQQSLHNFIGAMTRGQEDERRRLARELHDETLQSLIALRQRVQLAQMKADAAPMQAALAELESLSSSTIDELRRLTRALRPVYLDDLGLVTALEMLTREAAPLNVAFTRSGEERRLAADVELSLFRIVQEALSNVARHAAATQAAVQINFQPTALTLEVSDNGKGFTPPHSPAEFAPGGHYGLLGMHERVELIGGKLTIESAPGYGARLRVDLTL